MGGSESTETNTEVTNNNTTNIQHTQNITENNYNTYCIINGAEDQGMGEGFKRYFIAQQEYQKAIAGVTDTGQIVVQQKAKIAGYIEESLKAGLGIDKMASMFKQLNKANNLGLSEGLFNEVYANYFIQPRKDVDELRALVTQMQEKLTALEGQAKVQGDKAVQDQQAKEQAEKAKQEQQAKEQADKAAQDQQAKEQAAKAKQEQQAKEQADKAAQDQQAKEQAAKAKQEQQAKAQADKAAQEQQAKAVQDQQAKEQAAKAAQTQQPQPPAPAQ